MQAVGKLGSFISLGVNTVTGPIQPFGGAVDIVVVEQPDGTFKSSPWYVRFGKFQGVLKSREKLVRINVNGLDANFHMYLDHRGDAFFLRETDPTQPDSILIYPSPSSVYESDESLKSKSCNFDSRNGTEIVVGSSSSRRSRILGLMFGRRSLKEKVKGEENVNRADSLERAEIAADLLDLNWSTNLSRDSSPPPPAGNLRQSTQDACSSSVFQLARDKNKGVTSLSAMTDIAQDVNVEGDTIGNGKQLLNDTAGSNLQVALVEADGAAANQLEGQVVSVVSYVDTLVNDISQEDISGYGVQSLNHHETSESSNVALECSSEQVHVDHKVLHVTTLLLPEGTETEEVTKVDLGMPVMDVSEFHYGAQQTDCPDCSVRTYDVVDGDELLTSSKSQDFFNMDLERCSTEKVESNHVTEASSYCRLDDQAFDEKNMKEKDVSITLSSPLVSIGDGLARIPTIRSPSASSEEENFLFSDLDERRISDQFEGSLSPKYVDKDNDLSYDNGTEKVDRLVYANCNLHSSLENSNTEMQTSDLDELRVISSPIVIPRNEAADEEVGQHRGSLPIISSHNDSLGQHNVLYPLSQSLDSSSTSLQWTFPGKDNLKYKKSDADKENQLLHEEPGAQDYQSSGEFNCSVLKLPPGDPSTLNASPGGNWSIWPFSLRRSSSKPAVLPTPSDAKNTNFGNVSENTIRTDVSTDDLKPNFMKKKVRENTPTSEQLASLNLKEGRNTVIFTFSTAMLGKQQVDARIFLWKWNTRIVISDVDGTITKSDVLGQFMPLVGIDWSQTGVAHLFSAIKDNGYQLLFLSARSISQAYLTRQFLVNLKQDGKVLPDGPVVISPDGLFPSLYREVIRRVPHEFKIACLEGIRTLFPSDCHPFYAGFGNRDTDEISYLKVGIPKGKIFIINPRGEIAVNRCLDTKSYTSLHALVNGMFPPTNCSEQEDFNSWNFWKLPPPLVDI